MPFAVFSRLFFDHMQALETLYGQGFFPQILFFDVELEEEIIADSKISEQDLYLFDRGLFLFSFNPHHLAYDIHDSGRNSLKP
jgi:hypothetical protein